MTIYAGETIQFETTATDFDGDTELTASDVTNVTVQVFSSTGTEVLTETSLTYNGNDADPEWTHNWDTAGLNPGLYHAKIKYVGVTFENWEFETFFLARPLAGT